MALNEKDIREFEKASYDARDVAMSTMVTELAEVRATPTHWFTRLLSYWQLLLYT